ncbi:chemotaxis protein [Yersinia pestis]|nr:chemotaxis protein [Yersinia pestis]ROZ93613.1 chemotaxis protein [Yersinia pestis]ROZ97797.1 chemotaxis protein [Yersinia pestis]
MFPANTGIGNTLAIGVTNGAIVIHTQRLKSDPGGNLLS